MPAAPEPRTGPGLGVLVVALALSLASGAGLAADGPGVRPAAATGTEATRPGPAKAPPASPSRASVQGLELDTTKAERPVVRFVGANLFDAEDRREIENGVEAVVEIDVVIERARGLWFDESQWERTVTRSLKYDSLAKLYRVDMGQPGEEARSTQDFQQAVTFLAGVEMPVTIPPDGGDRVLKVRIAWDRELNLPLYIDHLIPFMPSGGFDSGWAVLPIP